jgi:hypothetical protein
MQGDGLRRPNRASRAIINRYPSVLPDQIVPHRQSVELNLPEKRGQRKQRKEKKQEKG